KLKTNWGIFDYSACFISKVDSGENVVGGDFAGELFGWGVRGEGNRTYPQNSTPYFEWILGTDYTFNEGIYFNAEYYHNGAGRNDPNQYDWAGFFNGQTIFKANQYSYLLVRKEINELMNVSLAGVNNLDDGSLIVYPLWAYNAYENIDLSMGALFMLGASGTEFKPNSTQDPTGYIGNNIYFLKYRYSF
ncbi:MAG: hypothetical protein ABIA63_10945, partial [bacterium]